MQPEASQSTYRYRAIAVTASHLPFTLASVLHADKVKGTRTTKLRKSGSTSLPITSAMASRDFQFGRGRSETGWGHRDGKAATKKRRKATIALLIFGLFLLVGCRKTQHISLPPVPVDLQLPWADAGKIYFVSLGKPAGYSPARLAEYFSQRFRLEIEVLPSIPLPPSVENPERKQVVAERLMELVKRSFPQLAKDPHAFLFGITKRDMYIARFGWRFAFTFRNQGRFAVISTGRLRSKPKLLQSRLRKVLMRNIGLLYYQLPRSADPTSVLYGGRIDPTADLDDMGESFIGTGGVWQPYPETGHPCITIELPAGAKPRWRFSCAHMPPSDTTSQSFLVDMKLGLFVQKQIDFLIDEPFPLVLTRFYRPQDKWSRAFGIGASHSLDIFLIGDAPRLSYIELILESGSRIHYDRVSPGTGHVNAHYETDDQSNSPFVGSSIAWNGNGWDLKRRDGWTFVFPASAGAKRPQQAALVGMHDANGNYFQMIRDVNGNLLKVTTPKGNWIEFEYDRAERVSRATDNSGRQLSYRYNSSARLVDVEESNERRVRYSYDARNQMVAVENASGSAYLTNAYDAEGKLVRQVLADGRVLIYRYIRSSEDKLLATQFVDPEGYITTILYGPFGYYRFLPQLPPNRDVFRKVARGRPSSTVTASATKHNGPHLPVGEIPRSHRVGKTRR